jgi:hypothetical protein
MNTPNQDGLPALDARYQPDGAIKMALLWLSVALRCEHFPWDADQHDCASVSLKDAHAEWSTITKSLRSAAPSDQPASPTHPACKPDMLVNGGALKMALNVLRRAGKSEVADELEKTVQPTGPEHKSLTDERTHLRAEQAEAVMPLIGPLLDAWDGASNDLRTEVLDEAPGLAMYLSRINQAMNHGIAATQEPRT